MPRVPFEGVTWHMVKEGEPLRRREDEIRPEESPEPIVFPEKDPSIPVEKPTKVPEKVPDLVPSA